MTQLKLELQCTLPVADELVAGVKTAVAATLHHLQQLPAALSCLLTDDATMQRLNHSFRAEDRPTDVLSFPAGAPMPGMKTRYLGDLAISVPYAERQATRAGHTVLAEVQLLAVHGVLHLLGYDHATPDEKAAMWAAQTAVLAQLGIAYVTPTEF